MGLSDNLTRMLGAMVKGLGRPHPADLLAADSDQPTNAAGVAQPTFGETEVKPVKLTTVVHPDGRLSSYPHPDQWDDYVEYDGKAWPRRVARRYTLVPTICFNCESGCGLLAYVDKTTFEIRKFEGNPAHPGSRGRNCAKGPATHNQIYDPERILYPLKRVGPRGGGQWKRVSWDEVLDDLSAKMRASRQKRRDGIMYHVGRPGEDHYANRTITAWGVDGHNSHTNICSAASRLGYYLWAGFDRPSPDYANARLIVLISAHLESGHYFNPHAQRIMEAKAKGAKIVVLDPRLSNTASKADVWLPTWPGSEYEVLLAAANHLIQNDLYNKEFVRRWVDWRGFLQGMKGIEHPKAQAIAQAADPDDFDAFDRALKALYSEFTYERAAEASQVPVERIRELGDLLATCGDRLSAHNWRASAMSNRGGWQTTRCLLFLNVLTGSVGTEGGTSGNSWNKFVPKPFKQPPPFNAWNELHMPHEWPFAHYEMSFLLPHFLEEGRGEVDVYFTRVYNPLWINPDGFKWMEALQNEELMKLHVAMTPTWNESAWFADYVLPMGHSGERHDLMSQETHSGQWIGFRQPVRRVAMERAGKPVKFTYEANPGEVWEEAEFWVELSWRMDPDGSMGIREWFESPVRPGEPISQDEYWGWLFEHSVPGLPEAAAKEGLSPLAYMRKYGAFEVVSNNYTPYEAPMDAPEGATTDERGTVRDAQGAPVGAADGDVVRKGFNTPSRKLELFSETMRDWGWPELDHVLPWTLESHMARNNIDFDAGEMALLTTFRLPTLIHTRSANAKWLVEISHNNPIWIHPSDAERMGVKTGDLLRVATEIGWFVDRCWVTEGIKPCMIAMSHHLGRWRLKQDQGVNRGASSLAEIGEPGEGVYTLNILEGASAYKSSDPDTERIWWKNVGVHQNLTHPVQPDPVSGHHCWMQKVSVRPAQDGENYGDVWVDTKKSTEVYKRWHSLARSAVDHSPDGTRRPLWFKRPLKPVVEAYKLPDKPFGR